VQHGQEEWNMLMFMHSCAPIAKEMLIQLVLFQTSLPPSMELNTLDYGLMLNNAVDVGHLMTPPIAIMLKHLLKQPLKLDLMLEFIQVKDLGKTLLDQVALL